MFKKINEQIENLFEESSPTIIDFEHKPVKGSSNFQPLDNTALENLSYIFSNGVDSTNFLNLFLQLSSYFELGFLFNKSVDTDVFNVVQAFAFTQKIPTSETLKSIKLPKSVMLSVLKTDSIQILNYFNMSNLDPHKKMVSYLIPITDTHAIVVMTQTAEPWAALKIETLQKTLMKIDFL